MCHDCANGIPPRRQSAVALAKADAAGFNANRLTARCSPRYNAGMATIETFANPHPGRQYVIQHVAPEFTSLCPKTGQPDFGTIEIEYVADRKCLELKSLKLYLQAYRQRGVFYEDAVNRILDDLVAACRPRRMTVTGRFTPRGGMHSVVTACYEQPRARRRRR